MALVLETMRPHQWVKNLFVLAPAVFARELLVLGTWAPHWAAIGRVGLAFLAFCLASGSVYLLNDLLDRERDQVHPVKCRRPIASGALPRSAAQAALVAVALLAAASAVWLGPLFFATLASYFTLNVAYSLRLKHVPVIDVASIALGFLLRVAAGAVAVGVPVTLWLYLATFCLAMYLALGKRWHELRTAGAMAKDQRAVLARYRAATVRNAMRGFGAGTAMVYVAYAVSEHARAQFGTRWLVATVPFIILGLWRFWQLAQVENPQSPTDRMIRDGLFVGNLALWALATGVVLYAGA